MIPAADLTQAERSLRDGLIADDRAYFQAGAECIELPGGTFAHMPDHLTVPAGACVHLHDPEMAETDPETWLGILTALVRRTGRDLVRIYLSQPAPTLEALLLARGFQASEEIIFGRHLNDWMQFADFPALEFRFVETEQDWSAKQDFHEACTDLPDGSNTSAKDWVAFERAKVRSGYMRTILLEQDGHIVGTYGISRSGPLLRLKNYVIASDRRRSGIGRAGVACFKGLAESYGAIAAGTIAIQGSGGERLYGRAGLKPVGFLREYRRSLYDGPKI